MGMYHGMDLSQFRVSKRDKESTTLKHSKGHEIKIAHKTLTPKLKSMIGELGMFAEGGEAMDDESPAAADDGPEDATLTEPEESAAPASAEEPPADDLGLDAPPAVRPEAEPAPAGNMVMQDQQNGRSPDAVPNVVDQIPSDEEKGGNTVTVTAPKIPSKEELNQESAKEMADMGQGHVNPETMSDLYEHKDTPGKVGVILGMLLSGAGSGLAHQPNALLDILTKQLDRDLQGQTTSAGNKQNWLKLNQQNELNKAQISAHTADTALKAQTAAQNQMYMDVGRQAYQLNGDLPPDQQYNSREVIDKYITPYINNKIDQNNANLSAKLTLTHLKDEPHVNPAIGVDFDKMNRLAQLTSMGVKGANAPSPGDLASMRDEAAKVQSNRAVAAMYDKAYKALNTTFAGQGNAAAAEAARMTGKVGGAIASFVPGVGAGAKAIGDAGDAAAAEAYKFQQFRAAQIATLAPMIARATAGRYNAAEAAAQADGLFPSWADLKDEKTRKAKYDNSMAYFKSEEAATPTLDRWNLKGSFPSYKYTKINADDEKDKPVIEKKDDTKMPAGLTGGMSPAQLQDKMRGIK